MAKARATLEKVDGKSRDKEKEKGKKRGNRIK